MTKKICNHILKLIQRKRLINIRSQSRNNNQLITKKLISNNRLMEISLHTWIEKKQAKI